MNENTMNENTTTAENTPPAVGVLALASDDTWLHLYADAKNMLLDRDIGTRGNRHGPIEFFDGRGRRLAPVFSPTWELEDLQETAEVADPCLIQRRLYAVVRHVEGHIRRHPELLEPFKLTLEEALARLPRLNGPSLQDDLAVLLDSLGPISHSAGFFHNALHAGGWTHG